MIVLKLATRMVVLIDVDTKFATLQDECTYAAVVVIKGGNENAAIP